jgi:hypothetical protein
MLGYSKQLQRLQERAGHIVAFFSVEIRLDPERRRASSFTVLGMICVQV